MAILVTGGAGFIGSHVVETLLTAGEEVVCIDNFDPYYDVSLKKANVELFQGNDKFHFQEADLRDKEQLQSVFNAHDIDQVIHLAGKVGVRPSLEHADEYVQVNVLGTVNLLDLAVEHQVKAFVAASSSSVYGDRIEGPFKESDPTDQPISPYAATKKAVEEICYTYHHLHNIPLTCLRFFTVYGERNRPDMAVAKFAAGIRDGKPITLFGNGELIRDFTYVGDIVKGILLALQKADGFSIFNIGGGSPSTVAELVKVLEKTMGKSALIEFAPQPSTDVKITNASTERIQTQLGFKPTTSLEDGLQKFVDWFLK